MKTQPYSEIINLSAELKEYKKLCKGKSKKFTYYLDWKKYISEKLTKLESHDKVENFKHFILNHNRVNKNINTYFVTIMIFCLNFYINKIIAEYDWLTITIFILFIIFQLLFQSDANEKEYCFYCDLIEIVEEIEKNTRC